MRSTCSPAALVAPSSTPVRTAPRDDAPRQMPPPEPKLHSSHPGGVKNPGTAVTTQCTGAAGSPPPAKYAAFAVISALPPTKCGPSEACAVTVYSGRRNSPTW